MDNIEVDFIAQAFLNERPRLLKIAYRLLGSMADAEDILQDVYLEWVEKKNIQNHAGLLTTMVIRRSYDQLKKAYRLRETYTGLWLPTPIAELGCEGSEHDADAHFNYAMMHLLEQLKPKERLIYVLRKGLELGYQAIAEEVQDKAANCRKIFSRAQQRLLLSPEICRAPKRHREVIEELKQALHTSDVAAIGQLLGPDSVLYADGGNEVKTALRPIFGREKIIRLLEALFNKQDFPRKFKAVGSGQWAFLTVRYGTNIVMVLLFTLDAQGISRLYFIFSAEKLRHLN